MAVSATSPAAGPVTLAYDDKTRIKVELDVTNAPTNGTRVWTDITSYGGVNRVRSASWTRDGRSVETERTQPGSATVVLDNRDGVFDRLNALGPFYGNLDRAFWFRISIVYRGTTYVRWTGLKNSMKGSRPGAGKDRVVSLIGDSPMKQLELFPLSGLAYAVQVAGDRVTAVLADANVAAGTINAGKVSLTYPAVTFEETDTTSALSHLQLVEQDERGLLFSDPSGEMVFQDRYYRANLLASGPSATLGESPGDVRYVEADIDDETQYLWNEVAVTPAAGGAIQVVLDSTSESQNFTRRLDFSALTDNVTECLANAQWYVERFAQPLPYLNDIDVIGARDAATWPTILDAQNSDLFEYQGAGDAALYSLERVSETWPGFHPLGVRWSLSPASRDQFWRLGVAGQSELGMTTKLG